MSKGKSKKPAKPIAGQSKTQTKDPAIYGVQVRYVGMKGYPSTCVKCGKNTLRGMVRILGEQSYCSVACVTSGK